MDIAGAGCLVLALLPLLLLIAVLIRLDSPGPVFVTYHRRGRGNIRFKLYKFRSVGGLREPVPLRIRLGKAEPVYRDDDPQVTRVGRLIRRTGLDELPELLNVLRGEMSLVGPRPLVYLYGVETPHKGALQQAYDTRASVRPGLVGPSQLNLMRMASADAPSEGRDRFDAMIREDAEYAESRSLLGDLRFILRAPLAVLRDRRRL